MCGFAGWVDLDRDLSLEEETIRKMTDKLSKRGPDDHAVHMSRHALLGHRRLVVVDPQGGAQPMSRTEEGNCYTIIYNGELYNTEDIRKKLVSMGYSFRSYSDTEVLLTAYIAWGVDCLKEFNGIYAFAIWDESRRQLFMARDPLGVKPLFYTKKGGSLMFGSEIKALLAHPEIEPILDSTGIMEIFGLGPARSPGSGVFKDICEIQPGYYLIFNSKGLQIKRYWSLISKPHTDSLETTIEKVRELFIDAVKRQLVADVPVCTFLSGGLDSSAISSVAASTYKELGMQVQDTYSIDYQDNELYFKADDYQPNSDGVWAKMMAEYIGSSHHNIIVDTQQLAEALYDAVLANDLPGMADIDSSLYLFCKEVRKNATVAISGECADEIFGGYPWYRREEDINAGTFPWSKALSERRNLLSGELSKLQLEDYVQSKYYDTLNEIPKEDWETDSEHRMKEIFYLNLKWFMITLLNRKDRMSMANSLEVRVPFADYRIVEYAYNVPWSMKYCDNREKGLLRRALTGVLPQQILERKKSPYPKTHNPAYLKILQDWMTEILQDKNSPILQLVNIQRVKEIVESGGNSFGKPWFGQLMKGPQLIAYLIQINLWLKEYKIRIV